MYIFTNADNIGKIGIRLVKVKEFSVAVAPVGIYKVKCNTNYMSFGARKDKSTSGGSGASVAAKAVPVVVLMTLNPSLLNAKVPENEINPNNIVMVSPNIEAKAEKSTYVIAPEVQQIQSGTPYCGWEIFRAEKILYSKNIVSRGTPYTVVYTNYGKPNSKEINNIYFVPRTDNPNVKKGAAFHPPEVKELIIHDLPNGKQFSTVRTYEDVMDKSGNPVAFREKEIYIDDDTAQHIYDLLYGDPKYTPWINKSYITYKITDNANVMKDKTVYR